jgi:Xaa-Pro dipeptidase
MKKVPFPELPSSEFDLRIKKCMKLMDDDGLDGMLLFNGKNLMYFFGLQRMPDFHWFHAGILTRNGNTGVVVPQILHEVARQTTWIEDDNIRPWGGASHWGFPSDPISTVVGLIKDFGLENKRIGVESDGPAHIYMHVGTAEFAKIREALPKTEFINATPTIWKQRSIKTSWEIDIIRRLCQITAKGIKTSIDSISEGMTEREVLKTFWKTVISEGAFDATLAGEMVFRGGAKDYAMSIGSAVDAKLTRGRQMFFDGGASLKGYQVDMQRQFCIGEPPALQKRLVEISETGQKTAERLFKPGNRICDVHRAAMSVIGKVPGDLKDEIRSLYSHTFMGHCIGLNIHEPPWIIAEDETVMVAGMIFSMEIPALDIPEFRVLGGFPEDIYLITNTGHEVLTSGIERKEFILK